MEVNSTDATNIFAAPPASNAGKARKKRERVIDAKVNENDLSEQAEEVSLRPLCFADYISTKNA